MATEGTSGKTNSAIDAIDQKLILFMQVVQHMTL